MFVRAWLLMLSFFFLNSVSATEVETGTLIVSYQTGPKEERLERVRFRLSGEQISNQQLYPKGNHCVTDTHNHSKTIAIENLTAGTYTIEFIVPNADGLFENIPKREVEIRPNDIVKVDQYIRPRYASIKAQAETAKNTSPFVVNPTITLIDKNKQIRGISTDGKLSVGHLCPGRYTIVFEKITGYLTPDSIELSLSPNETAGPFIGNYSSELEQPDDSDNAPPPCHGLVPGVCQWCKSVFFDVVHASNPKAANENRPKISWQIVDEGGSIIGDPFHDGHQNELPPTEIRLKGFQISTYLITNELYASWLTTASANKKIIFNNGIIVNNEGKQLCQTVEANPLSQIIATNSFGITQFTPTPGKESHPVILVSWEGAVAFCKDNNCRLPTEAEWEKAAGVARTNTGNSIKKFRYGFSQDTIDSSWANYKSKNTRIQTQSVLTTPVGYYNGTNNTHNAKSPWGAYDMSGNVWEWVSDWYQPEYVVSKFSLNPQGPSQGIEKLAKGGCYDSLADGVRVSERLPLLTEYMDIYTGFRVSRDL